MRGSSDIELWSLVLGFAGMLVPLYIFYRYRVRLIRDMFISLLRMVVQLLLVAVYLEWIFRLNNALVNALWVIVMILVGAGTVVGRIGLSWKTFFIPLSIAGLISTFIIDTFFIGTVVRPDYLFDAMYFIPITGMVLGNSMNHTIVGLTTFFSSMKQKRELYYFLLTNGGSRRQALLPFINEALVKGLNPMLASMSVMGLISLPGMMTGQILGGASPAIAIKYQIMIMLAIFVGCSITLTLSILFSMRRMFDAYGNLKELKTK